MRSAPTDPELVIVSLRKLWDDTFRGLFLLLAYCRRLSSTRSKSQNEASAAAAEATPEPNIDDLDFSDFGGPEQKEEESFDLEGSEIGDLLAGIDEAPKQSGEAERWTGVLEKVVAIESGLRTQYLDATERMNVALSAGQVGQVLALLDDTQSSSNEGIHALVSAVYEAFVPQVDAGTVVPEYLTSLKRALLVRRGIAELAMQLAPHNDVLQASDPSEYEEALAAARKLVRTFVASIVCHAMRAADRWEMVRFDRELQEGSPAAARMTVEGLTKYLESLGSINQREVLVLHDQKKLAELREAIATARELTDLSPRTAHEMLIKACHPALALRGKHPGVDQLLRALDRIDAESSSPSQNGALIERLEGVLNAAGG
jgi:hypothetical protein